MAARRSGSGVSADPRRLLAGDPPNATGELRILTAQQLRQHVAELSRDVWRSIFGS
jgi:hypothetical protein